MPRSFAIIVTGLPASGKTTLAGELATRYRVPLLGKDLVKEALLDVLGAEDPRASRRLSDASFRVLAAVAAQLARAGASLVLEGNFRRGEHEALLAPLGAHARIAQVLCFVEEDERRARLRARAVDPRRHRGHRDLELAGAPLTADQHGFLDLPGEKLAADGPLTASLDDFVGGADA